MSSDPVRLVTTFPPVPKTRIEAPVDVVAGKPEVPFMGARIWLGETGEDDLSTWLDRDRQSLVLATVEVCRDLPTGSERCIHVAVKALCIKAAVHIETREREVVVATPSLLSPATTILPSDWMAKAYACSSPPKSMVTLPSPSTVGSRTPLWL